MSGNMYGAMPLCGAEPPRGIELPEKPPRSARFVARELREIAARVWPKEGGASCS